MSAPKNYVLHQTGLDPKTDKYLREKAFNENISQRDLTSRLFLLGAQKTLEEDLRRDARSRRSNRVSPSALRAAVDAGLLAKFPSRKAKMAVR